MVAGWCRTQGKNLFSQLFFFNLFFVEVQLNYNVMLITAVQQGNSVIHKKKKKREIFSWFTVAAGAQAIFKAEIP